MATSKILYMKDCGRAFHGKHLKEALSYITDKEKTQNGRLIGAVNCQPDYAFEQMKATKKKFGKLDKRQAYHLIISFKERELDADTAFEITQKFVEEYLGKQYEAVYTVHDNTAHIHSHIVFNSVNFLDGRKYRYEKGDWAKYIQPITNRLCEEYGLSIIELEDEKMKSDEKYREWNEYKNGPFVWSDMIKRDLDACIVQAETFDEFTKLLKEKGYELQYGKYFAVKPRGMGRFRRCRTLGEEYTEKRIRERIASENLSTFRAETFEQAERIVFSKIPRGKRSNLSGLQKQYYARLYRLGLLKQKPYSKAWKFKDEIRQMKKLQEQYLFLIDHDIESVVQLQAEAQRLTNQKKEVSSEKSKVYRARKKCESLFEIMEQMQELYECEAAFVSGDDFFQEEHQAWLRYEGQLKAQGYSYEEVVALKEHYRSEIAKLRLAEKELARELRTAKAITEELVKEEQHQKATERKEQEKEQIREKKHDNTQPIL